jgi:hypothetical protein
MGADFSNHRLFAGMADATACRTAAIGALRSFFLDNDFEEVAEEDDADRSVVVGPPGRWIFVGDSAGSTECADPEAFDALSRALSSQAPLVSSKMSDDAALHFYLYRQGRLEDRFGNAAFPFFAFATEEEALAFRGKPELWGDLLVDPTQVPALCAAWVQQWRARDILSTTAQLLGWEPELLWVGYTYDDEGIPMKYDELLRDSEVNLQGFEEFHFARSNRCHQGADRE